VRCWLGALGFATDGPNTAGALIGLKLLYALLPVLFKLAATALVWRFELDARRQKALRAQIETATRAV